METGRILGNEDISVTKVKKADEIIGLDGRTISLLTWHVFRKNGNMPSVGEWAICVENGVNVENIVSESGLMVSTVKEYIINCHRDFVIYKKNDIVPEVCLNV